MHLDGHIQRVENNFMNYCSDFVAYWYVHSRSCLIDAWPATIKAMLVNQHSNLSHTTPFRMPISSFLRPFWDHHHPKLHVEHDVEQHNKLPLFNLKTSNNISINHGKDFSNSHSCSSSNQYSHSRRGVLHNMSIITTDQCPLGISHK